MLLWLVQLIECAARTQPCYHAGVQITRSAAARLRMSTTSPRPLAGTWQTVRLRGVWGVWQTGCLSGQSRGGCNNPVLAGAGDYLEAELPAELPAPERRNLEEIAKVRHDGSTTSWGVTVLAPAFVTNTLMGCRACTAVCGVALSTQHRHQSLPMMIAPQALSHVPPFSRDRVAAQLMKGNYLPTLLDLFKVRRASVRY